jgi:hypothetical protein
MSRSKRRLLVVLGVVVGVFMATQASAFAVTADDGVFLCPAAGNATAAAANGQGWGELPGDPGKFSFAPGNNQAGLHVPRDNPPLNTQNPGDSPGPGGGNSDWSPLWPGDNATG